VGGCCCLAIIAALGRFFVVEKLCYDETLEVGRKVHASLTCLPVQFQIVRENVRFAHALTRFIATGESKSKSTSTSTKYVTLFLQWST